MKQQSDWFTGIDYFEQYKEKDICVVQERIETPSSMHHHIQVELWYILGGIGEVNVNGVSYPLKKDSFFCLYPYHMSEITSIKKPVDVIIATFYIGVFMHTMWEKHKKGINARIVYETNPYLDCRQNEIGSIMNRLYHEATVEQFGSRNMILYQVLEAHTLFCRYALADTSQAESPSTIWKCIQSIIVSPTKHMSLEECAKEMDLHPQYLNDLIKQKCGHTFHALYQYSIVLNACALLHFNELSISYIVDLLNLDSSATFYRIFEKFTGKSPLDYRNDNINQTSLYYSEKDLYLRIQHYLHLHFYQDIHLESMAKELHCKAYRINQVLKEEYQSSFTKELTTLRMNYACILLMATSESITKIAMDCGFSSTSTFQRSFLASKSMSPKQFRILKNDNKT